VKPSIGRVDILEQLHYTCYQDSATIVMRGGREKVAETRVAIGQVKRDISELVNRVAYGGERVILTSRGKPKAALVSMADYERLRREQVNDRLAHWQAWVAESDKLTAEILARREGEPLDVDALWQAARADLEARDGQIPGH
jgi:prevent-host-death family protein